MRVAAKGAAVCAPGQAWKDLVEFAGAELLPVGAILGNDTVASNLSEHHAESEHVGGLVKSTGEGLRCQVVTIALAIDVLRRRPRAGEAKVGNLQATLKVDQDIGGLQVEVNVARAVDEVQALWLC